jgi:hypothetical protein
MCGYTSKTIKGQRVEIHDHILEGFHGSRGNLVVRYIEQGHLVVEPYCKDKHGELDP